MEEMVEMTKKEIDRHHVILKLKDKEITQIQAAKFLNLSTRQIRNLLTKYNKFGLHGLVSKQRKRPSNRAFKKDFKKRVMALVHERYPDFGPTFAMEKLLEYHNISISEETLRQWMIKDHLWIPRIKRKKLHPLRPRRDFFGELIQIDASLHHWFEDRGSRCSLIVFIDDATSKITGLSFYKSECLEAYFSVLNDHILKYGRPLSLYSDRHAIFGGQDRIHHAQFKRAISELGIENILARTPQAKGRVERVNQTLQDRLVKEMRLRNIDNIDDANKFLPEFIDTYNKKFSKEPRGQFDAHRPLDSGYDLERILTRCEIRTLTKDLVFSFHNTFYKIQEENLTNRLSRQKVEIRSKFDNTFKVFYKEKELNYIALEEEYEIPKVLDNKEKLVWEPKKERHPGNNHPWKRYGYQVALGNKIKQRESMI